jgi:outer membrane protein OmpA-like peptidoglycan-associated protein
MKNFKLITLALVASLATGCAQMAPRNDDGSTNKTAAYGGLGALVGAVGGALINSDNRGKGALIGAAVGGLGGAGYGYYADKQEAELRKSMQGTGVEVQRQGDDLKLVMPGAITFATGSSDVNAQAQWTLGTVAESLKKYPGSNVEVTGHTDNVGSLASNNELSQARAVSVAKLLVGQGVDKERIQVFGAGPSQPIASNSTEDGRQANRRVEIKLRAPIEPTPVQ